VDAEVCGPYWCSGASGPLLDTDIGQARAAR
jgi:hypothetical protein